MEEHVSSLSNVTGDLKKAVCFGEHVFKILEFFVSRSDVLNSKRLKLVFCMSMVIKMTKVNNKSLHKKIVKRETFLDTFPYMNYFF